MTLRVLVLSDLHLEFGPLDSAFPDADVVILAGDINLGLRGLEWARAQFRDRPVIYVAGNHEYYGHAVPKLTDQLAARGRELGIHVLEQGQIEIGGILFFGATLWTDFALYGSEAEGMAIAQASMTDYRKIRVSPQFRKVHPRDLASRHAMSRRWLGQLADGGDLRGSVIVTHHAPSIRSIAPARQAEAANVAYASHLDELVARSGARLWVHGHTHHCVDYTIGDTRVLSNQRGYVGEVLADFDPGLIVSV